MPGLVRGMARTAAVVGTASAVRGNVGRRQQQKYAAEDAQAQAQAAPVQEAPAPAPVQAAPVAAPAQDDTIAQLEQLAQLKEQGILTEEEFTAKKAQILGL